MKGNNMKYKLNNLEVTDVEVDGLDLKDYPDFVMAYIDSAKFVCNGKELNDEELIKLQEENADLFYEDLYDKCIDIAEINYG
jgi:hypothetical protein